MIVKVEGVVLAVRNVKKRDGSMCQELDFLQAGNGRRSVVTRLRAAAEVKVLPSEKPQVVTVSIEEREFQGRRFTTYDLVT